VISKALDNGPVEIVPDDLRLTAREPAGAVSGLQKEIEITLGGGSPIFPIVAGDLPGGSSCYVRIRGDPPQKAGLFAEDVWAAYSVGGELCVKPARAVAGADYPDFGCSVEIFTNAPMLELETLGPLAMVEPGASLKHTAEWSLHTIPVSPRPPRTNSRKSSHEFYPRGPKT
jgi:hypothetical protein